MYIKLRNILLRSVGYGIARELYERMEQRKLENRIRTFFQTGNCPLPDTVLLESTQRCNLRCKMCYQNRASLSRSEEITLEQIITFLESAPFFRRVALCGGEIFIRHDMAELICYLDKIRDIIISTNGTLVGKAELEVLRSCRRLVSVSISLDGPRLIHDSIRGIPGTFDKVIQTIKTLIPVVPVSITCVILNENFEFLPDMVELCGGMGVKKMKFELERIYTEDNKSQSLLEGNIDLDSLPLSSKRSRSYSLESFQNTVYECKKRAKLFGLSLTFDPQFLMKDIQGCYESNLRKRRNFICQAFRMATITPDGDLIHCFAIRKPFGSIVDLPFGRVWNSDSANTFRRALLKNNLTSICENCLHLNPVQKNLFT